MTGLYSYLETFIENFDTSCLDHILDHLTKTFNNIATENTDMAANLKTMIEEFKESILKT